MNSPKYKNESNMKISNYWGLHVGEVFIPISQNIIDGIFDYYQISNFGKIFHKYIGKFLNLHIGNSGYYYCYLQTDRGPKYCLIHRLVLRAFQDHPNHYLLDVNHKDGNKLNNDINNLEWMTRSENIKHSYNTGLSKINENNVHTNLTNDIVIKVCQLLSENNYTNQQIVDILGSGLTVSKVESIKQRKSWVNISKEFDFVQRPGKIFTDEMVNNICTYFQNNNLKNYKSINDLCREALNYYNYDNSMKTVDLVRKIYTRNHYTKISSMYTW